MTFEGEGMMIVVEEDDDSGTGNDERDFRG